MMSEQRLAIDQLTTPNGQPLIQPEAVNLNALLDISRIINATESVAHVTGATIGVLTLDNIRSANSTLYISRNGKTEEIDEKCLEQHRQAALNAAMHVQPIAAEWSVYSTLRCLPICLRYNDTNYPKAIITVESDNPEPATDLLKHLSESFSNEITILYSAYIREYQLNKNQFDLREENARLGLFLEHVGGALAVLDSNCNIAWTNVESSRYFAVEGDIIGKHCNDVLDNTDKTCSQCTVLRAFKSGQVETRIVQRSGRDGELHYYNAMATPILDAAGNVVQVMFMASDITELCRIEKELEKRTEMLEMEHRKVVEASKQKSQFFASVSHDLRTPLTSILGFTDILLEERVEPLSADQRHMLQKVKQSAERLLRLINDIMDISKLESGRMTVNISRIDLSSLIKQVVETMEPLVRDRDVKLIADATGDLPIISTDDQKLSQILVNLISNAIKFTPKGSVTVKAEPYGDDKVQISVTDTGIGISKSDFGRIFEEFTQVEWQGARKEGTGLGLAIARKLVQLLQGEISVTSKIGEGSTFIVILPVLLSKPAVVPPQTIMNRNIRSKYNH